MNRFGTLWKVLFLPLTLVYSFISLTRNLLFDTGILKINRVSVPVISIGNLTAGGTGKTPVTAFIARLLSEAGLKVGIVSRGFGRKTKGLVWVCREGVLLVSAEEGGDEPVELAMQVQGVSIVVGESRFMAAGELLRAVKTDVILVDDGFQHRQFHRDIDILVQDLPSWLNNRFQLPSGRFRESWKNAGSADALVWTKGSESQQKDAEKMGLGYLPGHTFFAGRQHRMPFLYGNSSPSGCDGMTFFAFCGIGLPDHFISDAVSSGAVVSGSFFFPDHHIFSESELVDMEKKLSVSGADCFLTTLKDVCRLKSTPHGTRFLDRNRIAVLPYSLIPSDERIFNSWLLNSLERVKIPK